MSRNIPPKLYTFIYSWKSPNSWRHFFDVRSVLTSYFRAVSCVWGLWLYQQTYLEKQAKSNQEKPTTWYSSLFIIIICILHQFTQCYKTRKKIPEISGGLPPSMAKFNLFWKNKFWTQSLSSKTEFWTNSNPSNNPELHTRTTSIYFLSTVLLLTTTSK